jgi:hypothetical protein
MTAFGDEDLPSKREFIIDGVPCEVLNSHQHVLEWLQDARANLDQSEVKASCMPPWSRFNASFSSFRGILKIKKRVCCVPPNVAVINWHDNSRLTTQNDKLNSQSSSIY